MKNDPRKTRDKMVRKVQKLIDRRLASLYAEVLQLPADEEITTEYLIAFCRAAYARGHADCMTDPDPETFYTKYGYDIPVRIRPPA